MIHAPRFQSSRIGNDRHVDHSKGTVRGYGSRSAGGRIVCQLISALHGGGSRRIHSGNNRIQQVRAIGTHDGAAAADGAERSKGSGVSHVIQGRVDDVRRGNLPQRRGGRCFIGSYLRPEKIRDRNGCQDQNDRDNNQELNQGKAALLVPSAQSSIPLSSRGTTLPSRGSLQTICRWPFVYNSHWPRSSYFIEIVIP